MSFVVSRRRILALAPASALVLVPGLAGAQHATSPPPGSPLRKALLDALRPVVARDLGAPIEFVVSNIAVSGAVAFVQVTAQRPGGRPIDLSRTPMAQRVELGLIDGTRTEALMRLQGRRWRVDQHVVGSTDVWWADPALCPVYAAVLPTGLCQAR